MSIVQYVILVIIIKSKIDDITPIIDKNKIIEITIQTRGCLNHFLHLFILSMYVIIVSIHNPPTHTINTIVLMVDKFDINIIANIIAKINNNIAKVIISIIFLSIYFSFLF